MDRFNSICLALIVVELAVGVGVFAVAMLKLRDAAQAVEIAAYRVDQEVLSVSRAMRSGWFQTARSVLSAGLSFLTR